MAQQVGDRFAYTAIGFYQSLRRLLLEPALELFHDGPTLALMIR